MQWFARWLDAHKKKRDYTANKDWRRIQQMAYGQKGISGSDLYDTSTVGQTESNDPQTVENIQGRDWTVRFDALGLQVPTSLTDPNKDEWKLFTWWQAETMDKRLRKTDARELARKGPVGDLQEVQAALKILIDDGVVYYNWYSTGDRAKGPEAIGIDKKSLRITDAYIPKDRDKFTQSVKKAKKGDTGDYVKSAKAVTYGDFHRFLNHGYLQLATNVLHDHFCLNGLDVAMAQGDTPYKIYGDNAMLSKGSAKMVKYSAETAHMSRDSIYELAATGRTDLTTRAIADRLPTYVRPAGTESNISLAVWHGENGSLHQFCNDTIFDQTAGFLEKSTIIADSKLAEQVSKDAVPQIHSGEAF